MEVKVKDKNVEQALKTLKRKVQKENLLREVKKRLSYAKPSVKKKEKQIEARKRQAKSRARMKQGK